MRLADLFESRDMCHVCGQTPCNCTHIAESADPQRRKLGRIIGRIYNEIYDMGDDALDYLNDRAAVWAELWDRYEGDIDSIIAEEDPVTLGRAALELKDILNDLQSDQGVAEEAENKDMTGQPCEKCKRGKYQETSIHDDMDGVLHCTKCGTKVDRWRAYKEPGVAEEKVRLDPKCWKGKKIGNPKTKIKGGVRVNNCVPAESVAEAGNLPGTPVVSLSDFGDKDNTKDRYSRTVPKKLKKDDPRVRFHKDYNQHEKKLISKMSNAEKADKGWRNPNIDEQGVAEVSDATLTSYLTKVDADSQKHEKDPTKRSAAKRNKSVAGFARAFNKLDARKEKVDEGSKSKK